MGQVDFRPLLQSDEYWIRSFYARLTELFLEVNEMVILFSRMGESEEVKELEKMLEMEMDKQE